MIPLTEDLAGAHSSASERAISYAISTQDHLHPRGERQPGQRLATDMDRSSRGHSTGQIMIHGGLKLDGGEVTSRGPQKIDVR